MEKRSLIAYEHYRDSEQRFEYFILGLSVALVAYVAQTAKPQRLGLSPYTVELFSVILIVASIIFGFIRIALMILAKRVNHEILHLGEKRGQLVPARGRSVLNTDSGEQLTPQQIEQELNEIQLILPARQKQFGEVSARAARYYRWRNSLLLAGFLGLLLAKVLGAYIRAM
jgi:hypothetical protein